MSARRHLSYRRGLSAALTPPESSPPLGRSLREQGLQLADAMLRVREEVRLDLLPRLDLFPQLKQLLLKRERESENL